MFIAVSSILSVVLATYSYKMASSEYLASRKSVNLRDQNTYKCKHCKKPFHEESSLLRHISHKIACKDHYGEELKEMRRVARLQSKRSCNQRWAKVNDQAERYEREKEQRKIKAKKRYQNKKLPKNSLKSEAFEKLYLAIYELIEAEVTNAKLHSLAHKAVYCDAYDLSMDLAMTDWEEIMKKNIKNCKDWEIEDKYDLNTEIEKAHEDTFQLHLAKSTEHFVDSWVHEQQANIYRRCWSKGESRAKNFFQDFCNDLFPIIEDHAMDFAFTKSVSRMENTSLEMDDFKIGWYLEKDFEYAFSRKEVVISVIESELCQKIKAILKDLMLVYIRMSCKELFR